MAFAVLSISQLVHAFNMRSEHSVFKAGIFKNPYLVLSLISGLILEVSVISVPYLANIFRSYSAQCYGLDCCNGTVRYASYNR